MAISNLVVVLASLKPGEEVAFSGLDGQLLGIRATRYYADLDEIIEARREITVASGFPQSVFADAVVAELVSAAIGDVRGS
jgi:hypothetical protein